MNKENTQINLDGIKSNARIFTEDQKDALITGAVIKVAHKEPTDDFDIPDLILDIDPTLTGNDLAEELYSRLMAARDIILSLIEHLFVTTKDIVPVKLIRQVTPEIERLYIAVIKRANGMNKSISEFNKDDVKEAVKTEYQNSIEDYKYLKKKHLNILQHELIGGQERRSFFGRILSEYLEDKGMKSYGEEKAYKLYKIINGLYNNGHNKVT
jgi:hypothetical protein